MENQSGGQIFYMEQASIYGDHLPAMQQACDDILNQIEIVRRKMTQQTGTDPVEHIRYRLKTEESMRDKCRRRGLPENEHSALRVLYDAIGIRVVCSFISDVYHIKDYLTELANCKVVMEKDYIRKAKSNGYRSYHLILQYEDTYFVEVQLRTISMDVWAALEHHLKYKKNIRGNIDLISSELKRCADELASTDLSMQTIRDMILEEGDDDR